MPRISQGGINSDEETGMTTHRAKDTRRTGDLTQVLMNLQTLETTYQSALAAEAKAIQPSLAAFLR
jgi:flagellin-like hook-associated protein FlgL